jgi:hypothetical protein
MEMIRLFRKLIYIGWTEFQTRFRHHIFFYVYMCYIKNKIQQLVD